METLPSGLLEAAGFNQYGVCDLTQDLLCVPCRARRRVPERARSLIVVAIPYYVGAFEHRNVARYAMPEDYHTVAGAMLSLLAGRFAALYPGESFLPFVDASPVGEVEAGVRAGLGVRGLNGQLINRRYGSYIFIGELASTVRFLPARPERAGCAGCRRCTEACPTGALSAAGGLCLGKCRSHLTQKKRLDDSWERAQVAMGGMVWGCDICTDVCPMNRGAAFTPIRAFYRDIHAVFSSDMDADAFGGRAYAYKGRAVLARNLALISGNQNQDGLSING